ncbi:MAG: GntR family transcriptional regulator [Rhizobiales bacterium 17-65-6]|nr:MAG: GntR family transcriptional regulator [Azorhizobium sp. 32-67-21]OYY12391.1 MAG: GntR family transcriptional regulator [Rhizobiales bacterium 35-68-8]OZA00368.1 MAG: GntR family transcriptional regulator [Rhizobiales bacterium 17-65-6]
MAEAGQARFERIQVAPAYQLVAEAIEREVIAGRLLPGEPVGTEAELVRQFGVNRSTVREGIRALEEGGFIQRGPDRRLYACLPRYNRLSSRVSRALILHEVTFRELFSVALALEVASAEQAVAHITPDMLDRLEENQADLEAAAAANDAARLSDLDGTFHHLVAKASGNRVLALSREPPSLLFFPTVELICRRVPEGPPRMISAHRHLIDAFRAGDLEAARTWMSRHLYDWRRGFERAGRDLDEPVERVYARNLPQGGSF